MMSAAKQLFTSSEGLLRLPRGFAALSLGLLGGGALSTRGYHDDLMEARRAVWQQTVKLANDSATGYVKPEITKKSIEGTKLYETREGQLWVKNAPNGVWKQVQVPQGKNYETQTQVVDQDSFVAARAMVEAGYRPVVLNMANKLSVGGGVEHGSPAQEECLFRASNYFQSLYPWVYALIFWLIKNNKNLKKRAANDFWTSKII